MIIIWRYLLTQYLRVLILSVLAFIAVLLTTRLDEIAHFASLGAHGLFVLKFTLLQIPYILPIAIPISCLISAIILVQRLSSTHELTAMRASGLPMRVILGPILIVAGLLSLLNFYIVSELATNSHLTANVLKTELKSVNPLLLLHNKHLVKLKGIYFDTLGESKMGEKASDVILAMPSKSDNRINLMVAKNLQANLTNFVGKGITLISSVKSDDSERFDQLMIENIGQATTSIQDFSSLLQKKVWTLNNDHLNLSLLRVRIQEDKEHLKEAIESGASSEETKLLKRDINRAWTELIRRISLGLAAFTFTFMGLAFGTSIGRKHSNRGTLMAIGLAALYLVAFFTAKSLEYQFLASTLLYLTPHALIIACSLLILWRTSKGIE